VTEIRYRANFEDRVRLAHDLLLLRFDQGEIQWAGPEEIADAAASYSLPCPDRTKIIIFDDFSRLRHRLEQVVDGTVVDHDDDT